MNRSALRVVTLFAFVVLLVGAFSLRAPATEASPAHPDMIEVGRVLAFSADSPHPAPAPWSRSFTFAGAKFLRLHFQNFDLADGDKLVVSSPANGQTFEYTGKGLNGNGDFWTFATQGEKVKVELVAPSGRSYGFKIVEAGFGTVDIGFPAPNVVCGTDGREDIACRLSDSVINATQKPVARLLFTSGGSQYVCTGELIRGSNANTMITNAHCVDTQTEVSTVEARFNYQYTTCGGSTLATVTSFAGNKFLQTSSDRYAKRSANSGMDYTLLTLQGNPEATFGELIPTKASYSTGTIINFIQHPGGNPKKIGYWEDSAKTVRCKIDTINASYGTAKPNSQTGYGCDSEGGSSGSAITRASDGKMIALHHYGGVASSPCLNSGTMMSQICSAAGSLLICDSN